ATPCSAAISAIVRRTWRSCLGSATSSTNTTSQRGGGSVEPASASRLGCSTAWRSAARCAGSRSRPSVASREWPSTECHARPPGPLRGTERASDGVVAHQREVRRAAPRRLVEDRLRATPARTRNVPLVAPAEPLDHDREAALHAELDQQLLVGGVEAPDDALR